MSLITDTLNKMKKEQGSEEDDNDKLMAPPALRNAVVNTKKYQEFVRNAEIKDVNGNKAPLKGFVAASILLVSVIAIATIYFLNKEDNSLIKQAGIVSGGQSSESGSVSQSLGKPYNPNGENNNMNKSAQVQNKQTNKVSSAQSQNMANNSETITPMSAMPDSAKNVNHKKEVAAKTGPINIIPANQLFVLTPKHAESENVAEQNKQNTTEENTQKPVKEEQNKIFPAGKPVIYAPTEQKKSNGNVNAADTKPATSKNKKNYTQTQQNTTLNTNNSKDYTANHEIAEVKAVKSKDPIGTVSASTISLYNQYIATGNKAKNEGSYERAIEYYTNALALNKNDLLSANIANMYLELKNPNMTFQVVVRNGMTDTALISALVVRMVNSKYFLESNKLLQYANTLERSSHTLFASGYYAQAQKQYETAINFYKDAMQLDSKNVNSAYYAAICYEEQGKNNEAVEMYNYIINNGAASEDMKKQASTKVMKLSR